jgi:hypothetical protein
LYSLQHIQKLKTLHLSIPFFFPDDEEAHDGYVEDHDVADVFGLPIEDILNFFSPTLESLRLCATHIGSVPIRVYSGLRELEIFGTLLEEEELSGLDAMFHHATSLESLSIGGFIHYAFASFLPRYSSTRTLPKLTSFRLSTENQESFNEPEFCALCAFLEGRSSLRRLYLRLPELRHEQTIRLLLVIKDLKGLEVLGLHTGRDYIDVDTLIMIVDSLSPNLRALHLAINWGGETLLLLVNVMHWVQCKASYLTFLS